MDHKNYIEEQRYVKAKKRVNDIKGFYVHLTVYILVNIFITGMIIYGLTNDDGRSFSDAVTHPGAYMTWIGWGIGVFFHWLGVFGFPSVMTKSWEERKIQELMKEEEERSNRITKK